MSIEGLNVVGLGFVAMIGIWATAYAIALLLRGPVRLKRDPDAGEGQHNAGPAVFVPFHGSEVTDA